MAGVVTQFTKVTVGRPRPGMQHLYFISVSGANPAYIDVIDRCQPRSGTIDPTFGLSTAAICTQTDLSLLKDGFRSFPSGHSSLSFAGLGFLAFYVAGKLHLFDHKGHIPYSPRIAREPEVLPLHHRHQHSETSALPPRTSAPDGTVPRPDPGSLTELWGNNARVETSEYHSESQSD
ncbi:hypothetical protein HHX47_DHR3001157 [Lentinula edodes]|nr:hypothetical protein HHX47_DHR3001157 [Lentinula edodes]